MAKLQKKQTVFAGNNWDVHETETGEIPLADELKNAKVLERVITVIDYVVDESEDPKDSLFNNDTTFIKNFRGNGVVFKELLTPRETALLMFLSDFICYNDCILRVGGNKLGNILTVEDLHIMYGMKFDAFRKLMTELKKKEVIDLHNKNTLDTTKGIIDKRCITFNPYVLCRGKKVDNCIIDHYKDSCWAQIRRQKVKRVPDKSGE